MNSGITLYSILFLLIGLLSGRIAGLLNLYSVEVALNLTSAIITFFWLGWFTYMLISGKTVRELNLRARITLESTCWTFFIAWVFFVLGPIAALIWIPFAIWNIYRSLQNTNE